MRVYRVQQRREWVCVCVWHYWQAVGLLGMMLAAMFPQYALAIKVAGFLWDVFHQGT